MTSAEETSRLVRSAQRGDRAALDRLLRGGLPLVYNLAARSLEPADADDVTQETMIRAIRGLPGLREPAKFRSWLATIALRETRRRGARAVAHRRSVLLLDPDVLPGTADATDDDATHRGDVDLQRRQLAEATGWLDVADRDLLSLWWLTQVGRLDRADVARTLGISAAHARVRLHRLRSRLDTARRIVAAREAAGRPDGCPELRRNLAGWDGVPSPVWRKRLARHLDSCRSCAGSSTHLLAPERLLAATPLLLPPAHLRPPADHAVLSAFATPAGGWRGHPVRPVVGVAAVVVLALALGAGLIWRSDPPPGAVARAPAPAVSPATTVPSARPSPSASPTPTDGGGPVAGAGTGGPTWGVADLPPTQGGRYLYVSGTGDDRADGRSRRTPLRTLGRAAQLTLPGDTVLVDDGEYADRDTSAVLPIERSGTPQRWITWAALPGARPIVRATGWQGIRVHAAYVIVQGFTVVGGRATLSALQRTAAGRGDVSDPAVSTNCIAVDEQRTADPPRRPHHVMVWGNTVTDCPLSGISAMYADHVTIAYNVAARNGHWSPYGGSGISVHSSWNSDGDTDTKMIVRGNVVHDNMNRVPCLCSGAARRITDGNGIIVESSTNEDVRGAPLRQTPYTGRTLVENNVVYRNGGRGVNIFDAAHVDVVNNTLYRNATHADIATDLVVTRAHDVRVTNTVVVSAPGEPAVAVSASTDVRFSHNLIVGRSSATADPAGLAASPRFVDADAADFRLAAGSPAVDSGVATGAPERDAARAPRTGPVDRGALERR
ncbi:sigma-70 family RNA polymerase sigma factor [Micromonospora sp. NPDC005324]|uniref:sigma-70 family RNA polymerase sigma factor n=1 Tax=Micromonospora sp. NPDC005324 TaxID=3157033 RepID=UPI0033AC81D2